MSEQDSDVLVVGGGAVGVACAYYLARNGAAVTLVEKGEVCSGCSYGNAGLLVPSHCIPLAAPGVVAQALKWMGNPRSPFYIRPRFDLALASWLWRFFRSSNRRHVARSIPLLRDLSFASLELYDELDDIPGFDFGLNRKGYLSLSKSAPNSDHSIDLLNDAGVEARVLSAEETAELVPGVELDIGSSVFFPQDWNLIPYQFVTGLAEQARAEGVNLCTNAEVLDLELSGSHIAAVHTTRGTFRPSQVVFAAGSWSPLLGRKLGLKLPIQAGKGYSISFERPPNSPEIPLSLGEARVGISTMGDTLRFAGTLELSGLDMGIDAARVRAILDAVPTYLPGLDPARLELVEIWRGLRPCTPDGLPLLGRVGRISNLIIAAGHAMIGVSLAPITGKLVAEISSGDSPSIDLSLTRPDRF